MRNIFFILFFILFTYCNSFSKKPDYIHSTFYRDIDLFKMKGEKPIEGNSPVAYCFQIDSLDENNIILTYWHSETKKYSRKYTKKGNYWLTNYPIIADTLDLIVQGYIGKDKITQLEYKNDSIKDNLKFATVYKDSIEKIYFFNDLTLKPNSDIDFEDKSFYDQIQGKGIVEYHIENGKLRIIRTTFTKYPGSHTKDTSYHDIGSHSIFWWREFGN